MIEYNQGLYFVELYKLLVTSWVIFCWVVVVVVVVGTPGSNYIPFGPQGVFYFAMELFNFKFE